MYIKGTLPENLTRQAYIEHTSKTIRILFDYTSNTPTQTPYTHILINFGSIYKCAVWKHERTTHQKDKGNTIRSFETFRTLPTNTVRNTTHTHRHTFETFS